MKEKIFTLGFILTSVFGWSQKTAIRNINAYAQETTRGSRPEIVVDENGNEIAKTIAVKINYLIYAEQVRTTQIVFTTVWIDGKAYKIKADTVIAPVEMTTQDGFNTTKIILAPATKNKLWSLSTGSLITKPPKPSSTLQKLINKNELVIVYRWKGKLYYTPLKKIKKLDPAVAV